MKAIPAPGTYSAALTAQIVLYETENGAFCAAVPLRLVNSEVAWQGKTTVTLVKQDGTAQAKALATMREVFGFDIEKPPRIFRFSEDAVLNIAEIEEAAGLSFDVVGDHEPYTPEGGEETMVFKIKYINSPGGNVPEPMDKKTAVAKYQSKFKALLGKPGAAAGKTAATPKPAATPAPATTPPVASGAPSRPAASAGPPARRNTGAAPRTSTQQEVWDALWKKNQSGDKLDDAALGTLYWNVLDTDFPGRNGELNQQEWGTVADKLGV